MNATEARRRHKTWFVIVPSDGERDMRHVHLTAEQCLVICLLQAYKVVGS